jgi:hypothetical protein
MRLRERHWRYIREVRRDGKIDQLDKKSAVRLDRPVRQRLKDLGVLGSHFLRQTNAQTDVAVVEYDR